MKRFIIRTFFILLPIWAIPVTYVICDPLRVIWEYDDYTQIPAKNIAYNLYKTMTRNDSLLFNSFIVGSSRSGNWHWREWEKHLDSSACSYHLESSGDGIYNAWERITYVYNNFANVNNMLLIIDHNWLEKDNPLTGIQYRTPWQMRENRDYLAFQKDAFMYYFSMKGFIEHYRLGPENRFVLPFYGDNRGERHFIGREVAITTNPQYFYANLIKPQMRFYPRDSIEQIGDPVITKRGIELLTQIHDLFIQGNTNYKIVISPLFDQIKLNPQDKNILDSIFGSENVHDYSGINKYTSDTLNYYENSHYRPRVATAIMNEIYTP